MGLMFIDLEEVNFRVRDLQPDMLVSDLTFLCGCVQVLCRGQRG